MKILNYLKINNIRLDNRICVSPIEMALHTSKKTDAGRCGDDDD